MKTEGQEFWRSADLDKRHTLQELYDEVKRHNKMLLSREHSGGAWYYCHKSVMSLMGNHTQAIENALGNLLPMVRADVPKPVIVRGWRFGWFGVEKRPTGMMHGCNHWLSVQIMGTSFFIGPRPSPND